VARVLPAQGREARAAAEGAEAAWSPSVYLGLEPSGAVLIIAHRSEMGTGIRTARPMVAADALEADWQRVTVEQAIGAPTEGDQHTDGSKSLRDFAAALRQAGATARLMLERAAAAPWGVPVAACQARHHQMVHAASGRSLGYGALAPLAAQQPVPKNEELRVKSPAEFRNTLISEQIHVLVGHVRTLA
jgi:isoquinoline 1-oxidoreductase beta subunit